LENLQGTVPEQISATSLEVPIYFAIVTQHSARDVGRYTDGARAVEASATVCFIEYPEQNVVGSIALIAEAPQSAAGRGVRGGCIGCELEAFLERYSKPYLK